MALPNTGSLSTNQVMTELGVAIQPREWGALWALARTGSIPKNVANAGGPYRFPDDWYGYSHTPPADTIPPNAFTATVGSSTSTSNSMTWQMNGDNVAVVGYRVFRNGNIITSLGVVGSYNDTGLNPGTNYTYYIQAFDAAGNIRNSNTISMTTNALVLHLVNLGYVGINNIGSEGKTSWSAAKTQGTTTWSGQAMVIAYQIASQFKIWRLYGGFDISGVSNAVNGGLQVKVSDAYNPDQTQDEQFIVVKNANLYPANHAFTLADYNTTTLIACSAPVTIPGRYTGTVNFPFNAQGMDILNNDPSGSFIIMQYDNDYLDVPPVNNGSESVRYFLTDRQDIKLYYNT